jgi:hypothetical protein
MKNYKYLLNLYFVALKRCKGGLKDAIPDGFEGSEWVKMRRVIVAKYFIDKGFIEKMQ